MCGARVVFLSSLGVGPLRGGACEKADGVAKISGHIGESLGVRVEQPELAYAMGLQSSTFDQPEHVEVLVPVVPFMHAPPNASEVV